MPEVERAVAAGRVAHDGRERLPRRRAQLPAAPRRRDVREENNGSECEIEFAEHDTNLKVPSSKFKVQSSKPVTFVGSRFQVSLQLETWNLELGIYCRPLYLLFPAPLGRRGVEFFEDAPLVDPCGRRRRLEAGLFGRSERVVALKPQRDLLVRDQLQGDGRRVAAVAELVRDAHLARVLDVDDLELRGAGRAALADRHDDQFARTVCAELRDEARAHVALNVVDLLVL